MSEQKYKFDIFKILNHLSLKDEHYFNSLSEEDRKSLQPLVLMRWMSGTSDARQIFFLNELLNPMVFNMNKHKLLLLYLLTICAPGKTKKYFWNKAKSQKKSSLPIATEVVQKYFGYSSKHARDALPLLSTEDIISYAEHLGYQTIDIKALTKELKVRGKTEE
jgi:hypothetical protein